MSDPVETAELVVFTKTVESKSLSRAAAELRLVELVDGPLRIVVARHLDEREPARPTRGHVAHDPHGIDGADLSEHLFELGFSRFVREIPNKQPTTHGTDFPGATRAPWCPSRGRGSRELARVALPLQLL